MVNGNVAMAACWVLLRSIYLCDDYPRTNCSYALKNSQYFLCVSIYCLATWPPGSEHLPSGHHLSCARMGARTRTHYWRSLLARACIRQSWRVDDAFGKDQRSSGGAHESPPTELLVKMFSVGLTDMQSKRCCLMYPDLHLLIREVNVPSILMARLVPALHI